MIINFYKCAGNALKLTNRKSATHLATKNINIIPQENSVVIISNRFYKVQNVIFNIDTLQYDIYLSHEYNRQ